MSEHKTQRFAVAVVLMKSIGNNTNDLQLHCSIVNAVSDLEAKGIAVAQSLETSKGYSILAISALEIYD